MGKLKRISHSFTGDKLNGTFEQEAVCEINACSMARSHLELARTISILIEMAPGAISKCENIGLMKNSNVSPSHFWSGYLDLKGDGSMATSPFSIMSHTEDVCLILKLQYFE